MAKTVFGMNVSLDGYVDHDHPEMMPDAILFRYFVDQMQHISASVYGRRLYELMRYWDVDDADWPQDYRDFAVAWRKIPKFVVSRSLREVGPNASLVGDDVSGVIERLKAEKSGQIEIGGTILGKFVGDAGLIDEYQLYLHPVVTGGGKPFFAGPRPPLRLIEQMRIGESVLKLTYVPG